MKHAREQSRGRVAGRRFRSLLPLGSAWIIAVCVIAGCALHAANPTRLEPAASRLAARDATVRAGPMGRQPAVAPQATGATPPSARVALSPARGIPPCTARMRTAFHLRPRSTPASVGPELPSGTEIELLAPLPLVREAFAPEGSRDLERVARMFRVRDVETGREGFAFVRSVELAPTCPVVFEPRGVMGAARPLEQETRMELAFIRHGTFFARDTIFARGARAECAPTIDVGGDGLADELCEVWSPTFGSDREALVIAHHGPTGWSGEYFGRKSGSERQQWGWAGATATPAAVYLETVTDVSIDDSRLYVMFRRHTDGRWRDVFAATARADDGWTLRAEGGESLRARSGDRSQILRWDREQWRFVAEGGLFEWDECPGRVVPAGTPHCRNPPR